MEGPQKPDVEMVEDKGKVQLQVVVISDSEAKNQREFFRAKPG